VKILVFGNTLVNQDSIAPLIIPQLSKKFPQFEFKEFDTSENMEREGKNLIILDSVVGINKVILISDLDQLCMSKSYSMHDFDLPITLKLLKKIGSLDSVLIIGVPSDYSKEKAVAEVSKIISSLLSKNG
jgi:Ni,Fe-hydrogenase maturation factor